MCDLFTETSPSSFSMLSIYFTVSWRKERSLKVLILDFMSSEETGSDSGSGSETTKIFLTRPILWRSPDANNLMDSLDRKILRRRSERAKEMCRSRKIGQPSSRPMPPCQSATAWAVNDEDWTLNYRTMCCLLIMLSLSQYYVSPLILCFVQSHLLMTLYSGIGEFT